ncbi:MAG TPA: GNAT family N-acetyltransferase [Longimicrobiales bacterium]|nr:GNAT family N-acetyltransferase [Longimicrobiales bacterium]
MSEFPTIRGCPSLLLRPWTESDAPALRAAIDEDVGHLKPWLSWTLEEPATLERTRARLRGYVDQYLSGQAFRYAITPGNEPSLILGGAHLNFRVGPDAHDVGYWVRRSAVRQGIAAAAVSALVVHCFTHRGVDRLVIQSDVANAASIALAAALRFRFAGLVDTRFPDGSPRPVCQFELAGGDYRLRHEPELRDRARRVRLLTDAPDPND